MDVESIRSLYGYDRWANRRLLEIVERLPPERTRERFGASFDSIHGTLAHVLGAQITWLSRWRGVSPTKVLGAEDFADLAALRARWDAYDADIAAFLADLTPEKLAKPLGYVNTRGQPFAYPLWQMMLHVANHGTHHRSELADMLTRLGNPPPPLDLLVYYDEGSTKFGG